MAKTKKETTPSVTTSKTTDHTVRFDQAKAAAIVLNHRSDISVEAYDGHYDGEGGFVFGGGGNIAHETIDVDGVEVVVQTETKSSVYVSRDVVRQALHQALSAAAGDAAVLLSFEAGEFDEEEVGEWVATWSKTTTTHSND